VQANAAVDYGRGVSDAWSKIATFIPKLAIFLLILVIGYLVAKTLKRATERILWRLSFDRAVERGGVKQVLTKSKVDPSELLGKLVYYAVLLITLQLAFGIWGPNDVSLLLDKIVSFLPKLALAIIVMVVAAALARAIRDVVTTVLGDLSYGPLLGKAASAVVLFLGAIAALDQINVATTVTRPVLIAVLATIGGILVVGVGGGLIRPLSHRWEGWLGTLEREASTVRHEVAIRRSAAVPSQDEPPWRASPPPAASAPLADAPAIPRPTSVDLTDPGRRRPGRKVPGKR
jgi:hypothetical protein